MMKIIRYISVLIATFLVLSLTIGTYISKMKCDEDGALYLGSEVPSCSIENEVICTKDQEKIFCCMKEIKKSCCPEKNDKSCASETVTIQFNFETLVTVLKINFSVAQDLLFTFNFTDCFNTNYNLPTYLSDIPPPKLHKPVLSKIQSFLL